MVYYINSAAYPDNNNSLLKGSYPADAINPPKLGTELAEAAGTGHLNALSRLVQMGAPINSIQNPWHQTALYRAALSGQQEAVEFLLQSGADPLKGYPACNATALHAAARAGSKKVLQCLLKLGPSLDLANSWGATPLHLACESGCLESVQLLLDHGASPSLKDTNGFNCLDYALRSFNPRISSLLIQSGLLPSGPATYYNILTESGETHLVASFCRGHRQAVFAHLEQACLQNSLLDIHSLERLMFFSVQLNAINLTKLLLSNGISADYCNPDGYTPRALAYSFGLHSFLDPLPNDIYTTTFLARKQLAQHLSLRGKSHFGDRAFELAGGYGSLGLFTMAKLVEDCSNWITTLSKDQTARLKSILGAASAPRFSGAIHESIQRGEITAISTAWQGHAIILVVAPGARSYTICNRGEGVRKISETLQTFAIDPAKITMALIEKIQTSAEKLTAEEGIRFYYHELPALLSPSEKRLPVKNRYSKWMKKAGLQLQKSSNCATASAIAALRCCWLYLAAEGSSSPNTKQIKAVRKETRLLTDYAKWSYFKQFVDNECTLAPSLRDEKLLQRATEKLIRLFQKRKLSITPIQNLLTWWANVREWLPINAS